MIDLVESKDIEWIYSKFEMLNDRTKKHTGQIKELQKEIKKLKGVKNEKQINN